MDRSNEPKLLGGHLLAHARKPCPRLRLLKCGGESREGIGVKDVKAEKVKMGKKDQFSLVSDARFVAGLY